MLDVLLITSMVNNNTSYTAEKGVVYETRFVVEYMPQQCYFINFISVDRWAVSDLSD